MPVEIRVPEMGESITEATITRWLKKEGESVAAGEPVVELETDKVNVEVPADQAGVIQTLSQAEGATVSVGDVLAVMGDGASAQPAAPATPPAAEAAPASPSGNGLSAPTAPATQETGAGQAVTPIARRLAEDNNVDLSRITGTGPQGRITKEDVEGYLSHAAPQLAPAAAAPVPPPPTPVAPAPTPVIPVPASAASTANAPVSTANGRPETRQKMSRRRQTIATRLVEAQHNAAMLTTFNEVDMSAMLALRAKRKDAFKERNGVGLGFMSFFTKATIGALRAFPLLNAEIQGTDLVIKHYYDMGIAVSTDEGLVVPVVRDADRKTFAEIEKDVADLAGRARAGKLGLADLQGGTFTITNGGVFGSLLSTPILNAPQVGILGMHKTEERAVVVKGEIVVRPMMYLALSYDHRIVDGSEAVRFLVRVKELVEDPEQLLLEG